MLVSDEINFVVVKMIKLFEYDLRMQTINVWSLQIMSVYRGPQGRDIFATPSVATISRARGMRYHTLAKQNLRYIADSVAILGIIVRNMPMWQRDRNMAKKFVALMPAACTSTIIMLVTSFVFFPFWKSCEIIS